MSSAWQVASRSTTSRAHSPSPAFSGASHLGLGQGYDPFALSSPSLQTGSETWLVMEFVDGLGDSARWLERVVDSSATFTLSESEKLLTNMWCAMLLQAVEAAKVREWGDPSDNPNASAFNTPFSPAAGSSGYRDINVPMGEAPPPPPPPHIHPPRQGPKGSRPLPRPPVGGWGGAPCGRGAPLPMPDCSTRPSQRAPTFAQAACFQGSQVPSALVDGIVHLAKAFHELPVGRLAAMQERAGPPRQRPKKAPSTVHWPLWCQVLIKVSPIPAAFNPADLLDQVCLKLTTHHSKLVAQSVSPAYGGFSIATDLVASEDELHFIREGSVRLPRGHLHHHGAPLLHVIPQTG
jgi:hypothetical protein